MFIFIPLLLSLVVCTSVSSNSTRRAAIHEDRGSSFYLLPVDESYYTWNADTRRLIASTTTITFAYTSTHDFNTESVYCRVDSHDRATPTPEPSPMFDAEGFEKLIDPEKQTTALIVLAQAFVLIFWRSPLQNLIPTSYSSITKLVETIGIYSILAFWVARVMEASAGLLQIPKTITYAVVCSQVLLSAL